METLHFHAASPHNQAVHNGNKFTLIILTTRDRHDRAAAKPSTSFTAGWKEGRKVSIEGICKALGIGFVEVVDSYNVKENVPIFKNALNYDGLSVVISRRNACSMATEQEAQGEPIVPYAVDRSCAETVCLHEDVLLSHMR